MPLQPSPTGTRARRVATLFAAWLAFFTLLNLLGSALATEARPFDPGAVEVVAAFTWTALSLAIGAYHFRLRAVPRGVFALVAAHVPLLLVAGLADAAFTSWAVRTFTATPPKLSVLGLLLLYLDFDIGAYLMVVAGSEVVLIRRALEQRQRQADLLERSLARARLDYLEAQLQPHFLFNSLGAVSELAHDAPAAATRVLRQLAAVFRSALGQRSDEIPLGAEIVGIEPYLDIQRIRFADWLTIDYRVDDAAVDYLVPRFVLQPLIENAIRHGLSGRRSAGVIEISAHVSGDSLLLRVVDNGVGLEAPARVGGRGIGLANVRDRLRILYGDDERLRLTSNDAGGAVAELRLPARRTSAPIDMPLAMPLGAPADSPLTDTFRSIRVPAVLRRPGMAIVAIWLVAGLVWTQQSYFYLSIRGRLGNDTWLGIAKHDLFSAALWALLTPMVLLFTRALPLRRDAWPVRVLAYIAFGVCVVLAHNLVWLYVVAPGTTLFAAQYEMTMVVGAFIVTVSYVAGHREMLSAWLRARENDAELLRAELTVARRRAMAVQGIPPVLLGALDGIAETMGRDPAMTERQLMRLADYLRLALECTDERGVTPERERALHVAVDELQSMGAYSLTMT